jgi:hypothetical protein
MCSILSAITHKLKVSGHILIWTFLFSICGTRAQNLFAPFSYTLYKFSSDERDIDEIGICEDEEFVVMECNEKYIICHDNRNKMNVGYGAQTVNYWTIRVHQSLTYVRLLFDVIHILTP